MAHPPLSREQRESSYLLGQVHLGEPDRCPAPPARSFVLLAVLALLTWTILGLAVVGALSLIA